MNALHDALAVHSLGTPVVGCRHAPALRVRGEVDPAAIERFGDGGFADVDVALWPTMPRPRPWPTGSPTRPRRRTVPPPRC